MATLYASTVVLLPTHRAETNEVIERNRRIGVSLTGIADWVDAHGLKYCTEMMNQGYALVKETNAHLAQEAGVVPSIRLTTVKPSGTISLLGGVSPGMHYPTFRYAIRRMRVAAMSPLIPVLKEAGVPWEVDFYNANTLCFEFPIDHGGTRPAEEVSAREQFELLVALQRYWADNMVSCTIYFSPEKEGPSIAGLLHEFVPKIKTVSLLPHTPKGAHKQMPYEKIDKAEYEARTLAIQPIDWSEYGGTDGTDEKYCNNGECSL